MTSLALRLRNTASNTSGETMVETLVSVLISALALLLMATAIGTSVNIVQRGRARVGEIYGAESLAVSHSQDSSVPGKQGTVRFEVPISTDASGTVVNDVIVNVYSDTVSADDGQTFIYERS